MAPSNSPSAMAASHKHWQRKGKNAFELAGESELVSTLEQIQKAVKQGEFDELIEQQKAWRNRVNTIKAEKLS